jgi:hypothetical protein
MIAVRLRRDIIAPCFGALLQRAVSVFKADV